MSIILSIMGSQYNKQQQIRTLSFAVNSAFGLSFSNIEKLQNFVKQAADRVLKYNTIHQYINSDWETVWGPVIYSHNPTSQAVYVNNVMGLFFSPSQNLFVVAIAGINPHSTLSETSEDFATNQFISWKSVLSKKHLFHQELNTTLSQEFSLFTNDAQISKETNSSLNILLDMKDKQQQNQSMLACLNHYIRSRKISNPEIAIGGHSSGGSLASMLTLYMRDKCKEWCVDLTEKISISTYPFAGETPDMLNYVKPCTRYLSSVINDRLNRETVLV